MVKNGFTSQASDYVKLEPEIKQKGYRDMDRNHVKKIQTRKSLKKKIFPLKIINYEKCISKEGYQKKILQFYIRAILMVIILTPM